MAASKRASSSSILSFLILPLAKFFPLLLLRLSNIDLVSTTVVVVRASSSSPSLLATTRRKPLTATATVLIDNDDDDDRHSTSVATSSSVAASPSLREKSTFYQNFETYGPTLTLTLRDPFVASMLGTGSSSSGVDTSGIISRGERDASNVNNHNGLTSRLAALFHIAPSPNYYSDDKKYRGYDGKAKFSSTSLSSSSSSKPSASMARSHSESIFREGYMIDDGEIFLDNEASSSPALTSSNGSINTPILPSKILGKGTFAKAFHPEIRFHIQSRRTLSTDVDASNDEEATATNVIPPFPKSMPWLSSLACGMVWRPFPTYKQHQQLGYGYKLLSSPHHISCAVKVGLPRVSNLFVPRRRSGGSGDNISNGGHRREQQQPNIKRLRRNKMMDMGITYSDHSEYPGGTLEILLGKTKTSLPPPNPYVPSHSDKNSNKQDDHEEVDVESDTLLSHDHHDSSGSNSWDKKIVGNIDHKNNHFLIRLATGRQRANTNIANKNTRNKSIDTTIPTRNKINEPSTYLEYLRGSIHVPPPFFLRDKFRKGMCISPSYDFVDGRARCVLSGEVGSSGRTMAVLRLDAEDSTLTVVRRLDERKIIAPTISLQTGKIVYDWYLSLDDCNIPSSSSNTNPVNNNRINSSIRAHVDPTKGIRVIWTDGMPGRINQGVRGSCWVTDVRIPLGVVASGRGILGAADIRVGRRWVL